MTSEEITPMDAYFRKLFGKRNIQTSENKALENMRKADEERKTSPSAKELEGFIYVPSINLYMAKERTLKGESWNETHKLLQKENKFMPTIYHFTEYLKYLKTDYQDRDEAEIILDDILKTGDYRGEWLDARFEKRKNGLYLLSDHRIENKKLIAKSEHPLESCLMKDKNPGIDLEDYLETANSQGLPSKNTKDGKLYFYYPRDGRVARFDVNSVRADLLCGDYVPDYSGGGLGVFPCAEGAQKKS